MYHTIYIISSVFQATQCNFVIDGDRQLFWSLNIQTGTNTVMRALTNNLGANNMLHTDKVIKRFLAQNKHQHHFFVYTGQPLVYEHVPMSGSLKMLGNVVYGTIKSV